MLLEEQSSEDFFPLPFLQEDFDCLRSLCYPDTDVFLVCFSVVNPSSFQNITEKWIPEIRTHNPRAPVLLVGTQADLRDDVNVLISLDRYHVKPVPRPQAEGLADKIRAEAYLECSALTQKNLKEVFDMAIVSGVEHKARQEKKMTAKGIKTLSKCRWKKFFCFVWSCFEGGEKKHPMPELALHLLGVTAPMAPARRVW